MGELGASAKAHHVEIGQLAKQLGIDELLAVGDNAQDYRRGYGEAAQVLADTDAAVQALQHRVDADTTVLIKGSRSARMERVVEALQAEYSQQQAEQPQKEVTATC